MMLAPLTILRKIPVLHLLHLLKQVKQKHTRFTTREISSTEVESGIPSLNIRFNYNPQNWELVKSIEADPSQLLLYPESQGIYLKSKQSEARIDFLESLGTKNSSFSEASNT